MRSRLDGVNEKRSLPGCLIIACYQDITLLEKIVRNANSHAVFHKLNKFNPLCIEILNRNKDAPGGRPRLENSHAATCSAFNLSAWKTWGRLEMAWAWLLHSYLLAVRILPFAIVVASDTSSVGAQQSGRGLPDHSSWQRAVAAGCLGWEGSTGSSVCSPQATTKSRTLASAMLKLD